MKNWGTECAQQVSALHNKQITLMRTWFIVCLSLSGFWLVPLTAQNWRPPAGNRPVLRRPGAESILPGGRMIAPLGRQFSTGPGPWGLAISPNGKTVVTSDGGPNKYSLSVLLNEKEGWRGVTHTAIKKGEKEKETEDDFYSVFMGLTFDDDKDIFASEGNSGNVRLLNAQSGHTKHVFRLNYGNFKDSYSGDLVFDRTQGVLYVVDQANFRVVALDVRKRRILSSTRVGRLPFAIALSPNKKQVWVTNIGMFEYSPVPGAEKQNAVDSGLPFPAFGFPSNEATVGARRPNGKGDMVNVPGLGDPNVKESNSVTVINVENPDSPKVEAFIPTGLPFGKNSHGGSSPSGVVVTTDKAYVANGNNDSITVIDIHSLKVEAQIEIRIAGLETLRGILPTSLTVHGDWLLVAESGINAVGVIDRKKNKVMGHIPVGWFPTRVAIHEGMLFVSNAKGHGSGPNANMQRALPVSFQGLLRRGSISMFPLPSASELTAHTARVMALNGFVPSKDKVAPLPDAIQYVVLIVKENRTFDEVFGDIEKASNGPVEGSYDLARFGTRGIVFADKKELRQRFSMRNVNVTPNHHEMVQRWSMSDNFYADSEVSVDGHHWLVGSYPNAWTESTLMAAYGGQKDFRFPTNAPGRYLFTGSNSSVHPEEQLEAGAIWHHLARNNVSFRNYGEGFELAGADEGEGLKPTGARFLTNVPMPDPLYQNTSRDYPNYNTNIPDQFRATQFIQEVERLYVRTGKDLPRFLFIHLPNDHTAKPRPEDGYPFTASYVADNDYALGRIMEFLSSTPWWKNMAVFVTEDDAQGGVDHIDSHRTVLMVASPYAKKNYVSHVNSSFPGLLKTIFRLLKMPALNLYDATGADLADCFTMTPDFTPYQRQPIVSELFDPAKAKEPRDGEAGPRMDDPKFLKEQHEREKR